MHSAAAAYPASEETTPLVVRPLTTRIGAEIEGLDVTRPVSGARALELNALLNKWKVIFFRNKSLTVEQHAEFATIFGPIDDSLNYVTPGPRPGVQVVKVDANNQNVDKWHTDTSWMVRPSKAGVLRAVVVPDVGGDTMWADGVAAYEGLPDEVKERIEFLDALHDASRVGSFLKDPAERERRLQLSRENRKKHPLVAHPIVRTHPETGEKGLFLSYLCTQIVGMELGEGKVLLEYLINHYVKPEYTCRFHWTPNAIAVWDQRQTMHYAVPDYPKGTIREMHRIYIAGNDIPHR